MDVISFLKGFVNKSENINELITLFLDRGQYNFGALFYKKSNTTYELIEHISRCYNEIGNISFSPFCSISNITISNNSSELFNNAEQNNFRTIWFNDDIIGDIFSGKTFASSSQYPRICIIGSNI